jgi:predicted type IV restriction endonuclease
MSPSKDILDIRAKLEDGRFANEAAVSQGIVRRLLDSLSWPVYDTDIVAPEYSLGGRRVDYALCHRPGKPRVLIEVKQVGQGGGAERQLFEYAFHQGIQMAVLTDGREWHFFLPAGEGDYSERRVYRLNLSDDDVEKIEERLTRYLYYDAVRSGEAIEAAQSDYRALAEKRQIRMTLPEAWKQLVESEDDLLIELLAEKVRDLCGIEPDPDTTATFLRERIQLRDESSAATIPVSKARKTKQSARPSATTQQALESIGYSLYGRAQRAQNGADLMVKIFDEFASRDKNFLEKFAALPKSPRQKRPYLARSREDLYPGSPQLVDNARKLRPTWWLDTNMGNPQKIKLIKRACEVAGIKYGTDLIVNGLDP